MIQLPRPGGGSTSQRIRLPPPPNLYSTTRPNGDAIGGTPGSTRQQDGQQTDQELLLLQDPTLAKFAQTDAGKLLAGQGTGRVSARAAARQERLRRQEEIMQQRRGGGGTEEEPGQPVAAEGERGALSSFASATKNALNRGKESLRNLSPLEQATQPTDEELHVPADAEKQPVSDVPVLPEYMVAKIKEIGIKGALASPKKHSKQGLLRLRISGQPLAKLYWFELRDARLVWRQPPSGGKREGDGEMRGRLLLPELVEQVSHENGSAEVIIHCGAQRMHLHAVSEEQAAAWQKVLKRAAFAPPPTRRSGKMLWAFLRPRLKLVVAMQEQWGNVHMLYGKASSLFEDAAMPRGVRDPDSNFSAFWDICQLVLLLYVSFTVPYRTCFDLETPLWTFAFFFDLTVDIYFLSDLILNFRTSFYDSSGIRVVEVREISHHYLRHWFIIDFFSCLPVGYISHFSSDSGGGGGDSFKAAKALRLFRLSKMLRLARVIRILRKYEETINLAPALGVIFTLACILFAAHLLACFYYLVGTGEQRLPGCDPSPLADPEMCVNGETPLLGWTFSQGWSPQVGTSTRYITAMYLVFNAVENGTTDSEKSYALLAELVVGLIFGALAATITNGVLGASAGEQEFSVPTPFIIST